MNAIISVVGKDTVGILAAVSEKCAKHLANINDVPDISSYIILEDFI